MTDLAASVMTDRPDDTLSDVASADSAENMVPAIHLPERADSPVSEITERFLRAVIAKVPLDRIEELHLFSPLRQGGVETGIAVIAARVPVPMAAIDDAAESEPELALDGGVLDALDVDAYDEETADVVDMSEEVEGDGTENDVEDVFTHMESMDDSPYAESDLPESLDMLDEEVVDDEQDDDDTIGHDVIADAVIGLGVDDVIDMVPVPAAPIVRHTVYTAHYRLVQKGPERGRWEADVVDEADAPLVTVEMVVRGVQRRAGEESEILRYSARQIARALHMPWPLPVGDGRAPSGGAATASASGA